jgi:peptidoglycan hydrolase CwlO-like protein
MDSDTEESYEISCSERQEFRLDLARHKEEIKNVGRQIDEVKKEIQELKEWVDRPENPFNRV